MSERAAGEAVAGTGHAGCALVTAGLAFLGAVLEVASDARTGVA